MVRIKFIAYTVMINKPVDFKQATNIKEKKEEIKDEGGIDREEPEEKVNEGSPQPS